MNSAHALVALLATGCVVVPVTTKTESFVGAPRIVGETKGPKGPLEVQVTVSHSQAIVTAVWPRTCRRDLVRTVEVHSEKTSELKTGGGGGGSVGGHPAILLVVPVVLGVAAVSALVTAAVVASDGDGTKTREERSGGAQHFACPVAAQQTRVQLSLPSGATIEGVTNERASIAFPIPDSEPSGLLIARSQHAISRPVAYVKRTSAVGAPN